MISAITLRPRQHPVCRTPRSGPQCFVAVPLAIILWLASVNGFAQAPESPPILWPDDVDPNEGSGWLKLELAVLIDNRVETTNSEYWPPFPEVRFPSVYRWLKDPEHVIQLEEQYPMTLGEQHSNGEITLSMRDPQAIIDEAAQAMAANLSSEEGPQPGDDLDALEANRGVELDDTLDASGIAEPIPLEYIDAPAVNTRAGVDWLEDFEQQSETDASANDNPIPLDDPSLLNATDGSDLLEPALEPPVLPSEFSRLPVTMLQPGLNSFLKNNPDSLELSTSWLQPPEGRNLPIILSESGDEQPWPALQGFVELRRGTPLRMGINFWWNTDASYYPESYSMPAPPETPKQIRVVDAETQDPLAPGELQSRIALLEKLESASAEGKPIVEFVDPSTGLFVDDGDETDAIAQFLDDSASLEAESWPWRHVIQIADTRSLPEGSVRYFDHPVIKVIATWRELSWGEVYTLGHQQREANQAQQAIRAANMPTSPGSMLPPGDPSMQ